jgi:hypothetical protein
VSLHCLHSGATASDNVDGDLTGQIVVCGVGSVLLDAPTLPTAPYVVSYQVREGRVD